MFYSSQAKPYQALCWSRASSSSHFKRLSGASRLDRPFRAFQRSRKRWQVHCFRAARLSNFERPGGAKRVRAAISSAPAEPIGLGRPFRAPQRSQAGSSGHFERHSGAKRARCRKRWQVRCFHGQAEPAERVSAWNVQAINVYIYLYYPLVGVPKMQEVCVHVCVEVLFKFVRY